MRRTRQDLGFVALKIEGGILPAEFLQKVVALEAKGQSASDYSLPKGPTIKDEIGRAWRIASAEWKEYQENRQRKDTDKKKVGVDSWLTTLLKVVLGHEDVQQQAAAIIAERTFPITHNSTHGAVPLVLTTQDYKLDKSEAVFGDEGRKRSPHTLMQEYLNASDDCLWGIVSNGSIIRLLRDNPSLTRPAYIEADLERMFEEQLYADFAALWLIFHGSRFKSRDVRPDYCFIEEWRKEGHETGERALANLRSGVTVALRELGAGFLQHPGNQRLREGLRSGAIRSSDYYCELLRLVYRALFLLCVEDRNLLHEDLVSAQTRLLYSKGYSMGRLRECALLRRNYDRHTDLWEALLITFRGLGQGAASLGLPALGGLFEREQCIHIEECALENHFLLRAIFALSFFRSGEILARVNYRDMGTEELGSVYESLLELHPYIDVNKNPWSFEFLGVGDSGNTSERRDSGSYYTPEGLVNELIRTAVDPVIKSAKVANQSDPREALLRLKIIDPACGSGHFLLAAARRLASEIAKLDTVGDVAEESLRRHTLREVVQRCIYGVDRNPLAVELCKTALWIETVEPGKPLSFLDGHIRCGDSLIGLLKLETLRNGIPDEAYSTLSGDDPSICRELKKRNQRSNAGVIQGNVFSQEQFGRLAKSRGAIAEMPEENLSDVEAKKKAWAAIDAQLGQLGEETKANLYVAAFFARKVSGAIDRVAVSEDIASIEIGGAGRKRVIESSGELAQKRRIFHWYTSFPEVFDQGGFDVVLGNPPWEHTELKEREWFAVRRPDIANAKTGAERKKMINALMKDDPTLYEEYLAELRDSEAVSQFVRHSGRFPLCGRGRINTYAIFAETMRMLVRDSGRVGCIVPSGVATDDTTKFFFQDMTESGQLVSLFDFENKLQIFRDVAPVMKFCLLTLAGSGDDIRGGTDFVFFAHKIEDLQDSERHFVLSPNELALLNPNTRTCAIFRSKRDAELTKGIYKRVPVLIEKGAEEKNPWGIKFKQGLFNMTSDSHFFRNREELEGENFKLIGNCFEGAGKRFVPLWESKLFHQFNHRHSTFEGTSAEKRFVMKAFAPALSARELQDKNCFSIPRFWVDEVEVNKLLDPDIKWLMLFRNATNVMTNSRNAVFTIVPRAGVGNSAPCFITQRNATYVCALLANMNSFILDYVARQKLGGGNMNFYVVEQLPVLNPETYDQVTSWSGNKPLRDWMRDRVVELVFTASDLAGFAEDCGFSGTAFTWNEERRLRLRCELDAAFFRLYGIKLNDLRYIMDTFRMVREKDEERFGEYLTKRLIVEHYEAMSRSDGSVSELMARI